MDEEYPRLYRLAQEQLAAGNPPDAAAMQKIAARMEALSWHLSDERPGVSDKVQALWAKRSVEITRHDFTDLGEYVVAARSHFRRAQENTS